MLGFGFMMFLSPLLFTIAVVVLVRYLYTDANRDTGSPLQIGVLKPVEILDERLAHGDIDAREYEEKRRILGHG